MTMTTDSGGLLRTRNVELLTKVLARIEAEPESWNQEDWVSWPGLSREERLALEELGKENAEHACKTSFCFAGWVAKEEGAEQPPPWHIGEWGVALDLSYATRQHAHRFASAWPEGAVTVEHFAQVRLGLSGYETHLLFDASNTLLQLKDYVATLVAGEELHRTYCENFADYKEEDEED